MSAPPRRKVIIYPSARVREEAIVRDLFNRLSSLADLDPSIYKSLGVLSLPELIELIEEHDFMALSQAPLPQMSALAYENAGQAKWQVGSTEDLLGRTWLRNQMGQDWFKQHIQILEAKIHDLKDILHPEFTKYLGTESYSVMLVGSFIWKPRAEDLDMTVIACGQETPGILRLGNAYVKISGLHELFPWLSGDIVHLNCTNDYLYNSSDVAEPIWNMRNQASGTGLSIVGPTPPRMPAYTLLMQPLIMLGRQARTAMIFPSESATEKLRYRIEEAKAILRHILDRLPIHLDELTGKWLTSETNLVPDETYWSVVEREGLKVGVTAAKMDQACKEYLKKRVCQIAGSGKSAAG